MQICYFQTEYLNYTTFTILTQSHMCTWNSCNFVKVYILWEKKLQSRFKDLRHKVTGMKISSLKGITAKRFVKCKNLLQKHANFQFYRHFFFKTPKEFWQFMLQNCEFHKTASSWPIKIQNFISLQIKLQLNKIHNL